MDLKDYQQIDDLESSAGIETEILFADYQDIATFPTLPSLTSAQSNGDYVKASGAFVMKAAKQFHRFQASLEESDFTSNLVGPRGSKSFENVLNVKANKTNKEVVGFIRANRNRKLVVAFRMLGEEDYTVIGWDRLPAEVEEGNITQAAEISGEKGSMLSVRSIFYPPIWVDAIPLTPGAE